MPVVNHVVLASGAVVAVSMAVATAIAIYESPELRRYTDDFRRRIAMALHSIGEGINPADREPLYNRPEDAEGFMRSRAAEGAEPGVDADEETRRRQREELLYWNSVRMAKHETSTTDQATESDTPRPRRITRGSSFDDFLRPDESGESGAFIFNTGADTNNQQEGIRHRGEGARGFTSAMYSNPFADEHLIGSDEIGDISAGQITPPKEEIMSDIYSATTREHDDFQSAAMEPSPALIDIAEDATPSLAESAPTLERELPDNEYMVAGQDDRHEAYASIQAWAQDSSRNFYSPLPVTPVAPVSEPEIISDGQLTPTDSVSLVGSGDDIAEEARSPMAGQSDRPFDVMSESEGMLTPASWSEIGSVVSENELHLRA